MHNGLEVRIVERKTRFEVNIEELLEFVDDKDEVLARGRVFPIADGGGEEELVFFSAME